MLWDSKLPEADKEGGFEIHRSKGRLVFANGDIKMLQGVREIFEINDGPRDDEAPPSEGKIILIGRNVGEVGFESSFKQAVN